MRHLKKIKELTEIGIDEEDHTKICGLHGTSIEALKFLATQGKLPMTGIGLDEFYYFPLDGARKLTSPFEDAKAYAKINAFRNHLLKELRTKGMKMDMDFERDLMISIESDSVQDDVEDEEGGFQVRKKILESLNMTRREFKQFFAELEKRHIESKGVVLGIKPSIARLQPYPDAGTDGLVVKAPQGLPVEYIAGIEPIGQFEWDEISNNNLQNIKI